MLTFLGACPLYGQGTIFAYDASGNLILQTNESPGLPRIVSQPESEIVAAGELGSFSVVLADPNNAFYQWQFNGTNITRATNDSLFVFNVGATNQGLYSVIVGNTSGSVTSAPAMLWYDGNGNGLPDSWEMQYFGNLNQKATGDFDGDGVNNLQEFLDGTNPTNSASANYRLTVLNDGGTVSVSPNQSSYTNGQVVTLSALPGSGFCIWLGDIGSLSNTVTVVMNTNLTAFAHFNPVNFIWTNLAGGDWFNTTNWNVNLLPASVTVIPNAKNNAFMTNGSYTVTLNTNADLNNLTLGVAFAQGPTITGGGTLTVHSNLDWEYGTMSGSGRTVVAPGATMTVGAYQTALTGRTLENAGTTVWIGTSGIALNSAIITNDPGALFNAQTSTFINASSSRFDNAGTFRKSIDPGTTTVGCPFNNYGILDVEAGAVLISSAFTNSGMLTVASGATNRIGAGGMANGGSFAVAAGGLVQWDGASGVSFTLTNGTQLTGPGIYRINTTSTINANNDVGVSNLDLFAGNLGGTGNVAVSNVMNWFGGSMIGTGTGKTLIATGATLNASTISLNARNLENDGTMNWNGTGVSINSSVLTNAPGGLIQMSVSPIITGSACRIDNAGTFRKLTDAGTANFASSVPFNNYGLADIESGTFSIGVGGTNAGSVTVAAGTTLNLAGGTFNSGAASSITGAGTFIVSGAIANLGGTVNISGSNTFSGGTANLTGTCICTNNTLTVSGGTADFNGTGVVSPAVLNLFSGTLGGSNRVTVLNTMTWPGGVMGDSGVTFIAPTATLNASGGVTLNRTLENAGHVVWTGTSALQANGAILTNDPGALFDVQNNFQFSRSSVACRFDNAGTFRKSIVSGTTPFSGGFALDNYGTVDIETGIISAGGGFTNFPGALVNCALGGTTAGTGYGQLQVSGAMTLNAGLSVVLTNSYTPAKGDSFALLTGGTRSGTFTSFTFPSNQVFMVLSNGASSVVASITAINSNGPPSIASDLPASQLFYAGRTVSFPVTVFGATPFTYQWTKNGTNVSDTARISGSQTSTLTITNPLAADSGSYQLLATNAQGFAPSTASGVTIQAVPKLNTAGAGWSLQGSTPPVMNSSNVTLTSGLGSTGRSVFYNAPLYIGAFNASFLYKDVGGGGADGMSFCFQNDPRGATAQGGGGGGLGYAGITPSAAFEMNIYSGNGVGITFQTNGNFPASGGYTQTTPVNIASGNPIQVSLVYTGGVLSATLVESNTVHVFTTNIAVNLPAIVGGQTAYVGLTGGDGGISSTQVVSNFTFVPIATVSAQQSNAAMVTLSWPGVIGGYTVQSSSNLTLGAWQSVTNDILQPAGQNRVNIPMTNNPGFYRLFINLSQ